ncbi:hypothetical protein IMG5_047470 [Ichthyophthirius multifiliis]|uniref:Leucine rich repeat protein n=1 Tax=Ichthyophthirius multifiliis TaxID=5932 RepID=G0QMB6_ICHMU|nr:hypothetical protein IMG5_047470 [Ichthyophthirius multifiliis]EGR33638.1 hypothetical protein IMG5_047470 [Ichthyophthirius multifiliis]|eukprot:XP_004037624.1 hypothetical protein IMG5_047470 [Ichthyophthirius multifiliis]
MSKKGGKDKKKKKPEEEDESTVNLPRIYRRKCESLGVSQNRFFREKVEQAIDDQDHLKKVKLQQIKKQFKYKKTQLHTLEPLSSLDVRAIMESLIDLKYKHIQSLKLVKAECQDEAVQYICNYMEKGRGVKFLNLPHNLIGYQGCEYLGKSVGNTEFVQIQKLKLDFNNIGTKGLGLLAKGLSMNPYIMRLSLNYCNIDSYGVKYLQQILAYVESQLWSLKLRGNFLRNEGIYQLFRSLEYNQALQKLIVANNQFGESEEIPVIEKICEVMMKNNSLQIYDLDQNGIYDEGAKKLLECTKMYKIIKRVPLQDHISYEIKAEFKKVTKKRKFKLKKKKKKKKGKKKKKK